MMDRNGEYAGCCNRKNRIVSLQLDVKLNRRNRKKKKEKKTGNQ